jgi:hypothetical protein
MHSDEADAISIPEFCRRHQISVGMYFKIAREGFGPRIMKVGRRTLVSREAAEEWRRERELASTPRTAECSAACGGGAYSRSGRRP